MLYRNTNSLYGKLLPQSDGRSFLKLFDTILEVHSVGTAPSHEIHPKAVVVMKEIGIDLSANYPKKVDEFLTDEFDYVITVCCGAKESFSTFTGKVKQHLHIGFDDPADTIGTEDEFIVSLDVFVMRLSEISLCFIKNFADNPSL